MNFFKTFSLCIILIQLISCEGNEDKTDFSLQLDNKESTYQLGGEISAVISEKSNKKIDSLVYRFQSKKASIKQNTIKLNLNESLLGKHDLEVTIYSGKIKKTITKLITVLNSKAPKIYGYKILKTYPHNVAHYTQGLEFKGDQLFESAGKQKESKLLEKELETGKTVKEHKLKDVFFAEGLTIVGDKIHQLTWKGDIGFTYNLSDFKTLGTFAYNQSKEGWGLCFDGKKTIYKSDGTTKIWKLNAETLEEEGFIQITTNKALKSKFNELEWINGKIYANTWKKDSIAIINPENGAIEAIINLKGIREEVGVAPNDYDKVLNGIAYKATTKQLYITGKYWDKLFEIEIVK